MKKSMEKYQSTTHIIWIDGLSTGLESADNETSQTCVGTVTSLDLISGSADLLC